ncbi:MAG: hypothetical protein Q8O67_30410 [Deltaproteobacteria bacterium]|nr:hypothetical protein [Deltaproteobacteria bacterium]
MIRSRSTWIACAALLLAHGAAFAQEEAPAPPAAPAGQPEVAPAEPAAPAAPLAPLVVDETALEQHRTPLQAMNEHFLGSASRAVRFEWRRAPVAFALLGGELLERNNFGSYRLGALGRKALDDIIFELAVNYVKTYDTTSSQTLSLTPFRQFGRPTHWEVDFNVGYAIAEGVVTPLTDYLPPAEMVLVAYAGLRYLVYPEGMANRPLQDIGLDLVSLQLSPAEKERLERIRLDSMVIDPARAHTLVGLSLDVYFQPGIFVSPRGLLAVPVLVPVTGSGLGFWWELSIAVGYAL